MSGGHDHWVLMQRKRGRGLDLTDREADRHGSVWKNGMSVLLMSIVTVASNLTFPPPNIGFLFFSSFWLLFDLLKRTSYVSQGPAI